MFTKRSDKEPSAYDSPRTGPPTPPGGSMQGNAAGSARNGARGVESRIGADIVIMGNLVSNGELQIDGEVQGDVHGVHIVIGETARITGGIVADEIIVRGTVMGSMRGKRVVLQSSSKVEGDIYHCQLAIEQGAFFEGKSRRTENPTADVERPAVPLPAGNDHDMAS